jgi:hypothetical protein
VELFDPEPRVADVFYGFAINVLSRRDKPGRTQAVRMPRLQSQAPRRVYLAKVNNKDKTPRKKREQFPSRLDKFQNDEL